MIFVDTNVVMYAVGRPHPLRESARAFLGDALRDRTPLCTSSEVLQEFLHAYSSTGRMETLDRALALVRRTVPTVWSIEPEDVHLARTLLDQHPGLSARDVVHLASCIRRGVTEIRTFDRGLAAAFG